MNSVLSVSNETIIDFLEAAGGNYRNALYIECNTCRYVRESGCGDFLFIPGFDCQPTLLPLSDAEKVFGLPVDRFDCAGIINNITFIKLYQKWIELNILSDKECPLQQILAFMNKTKDDC